MINFYHELQNKGVLWPYVYLHGKADQESLKDYVFADIEIPEDPGIYLGNYNGNPLLVHLTYYWLVGIISGRAIYANDYKQYRYLLSPLTWR